jgi:hypothetical protein
MHRLKEPIVTVGLGLCTRKAGSLEDVATSEADHVIRTPEAPPKACAAELEQNATEVELEAEEERPPATQELHTSRIPLPPATHRQLMSKSTQLGCGPVPRSWRTASAADPLTPWTRRTPRHRGDFPHSPEVQEGSMIANGSVKK